MPLISVILAFLVACSSCAHFDSRQRTPVQQHNAMVKIVKVCPDGSRSMGSGVLVSPDQVLTAHHVVTCTPIPGLEIYMDPVAIMVMASGDEDGTSSATVEVVVAKFDIARIKLDKPLAAFHTPIRVGKPPTIGDRICEVSAVPRVTYRCGEAQDSGTGYIGLGFMVEFGNSGSGVYNAAGELVGITTNLVWCQQRIPCSGRATALTGFAWMVPES